MFFFIFNIKNIVGITERSPVQSGERHIAGKGITLIFLNLITMPSSTAFAQTLDQAVSNQLGNFCSNYSAGGTAINAGNIPSNSSVNA